MDIRESHLHYKMLAPNLSSAKYSEPVSPTFPFLGFSFIYNYFVYYLKKKSSSKDSFLKLALPGALLGNLWLAGCMWPSVFCVWPTRHFVYHCPCSKIARFCWFLSSWHSHKESKDPWTAVCVDFAQHWLKAPCIQSKHYHGSISISRKF